MMWWLGTRGGCSGWVCASRHSAYVAHGAFEDLNAIAASCFDDFVFAC